MNKNDDESSFEEESFKENLKVFFEMGDVSEIINKIEEEPRCFFTLIQLVKEKISSPNLDENDGLFIIQLLERLVQIYQVPAVIVLEDPDFIAFFTKCLKKGARSDINNLLEECLQVFSFDDKRETIPLIANFYLENLGSQIFPNLKTPVGSDFIELFCNIQNIFLFQKTSEKGQDAENLLIVMIDTIIQQGKFQSDNYSPLEQILLLKYKKELEGIKNKILTQREEARKAKLSKELYKEQLKKLPKELQLKNRRFFIKGEQLPFEESIEDEYKDYSLPLSDALERTLSKTICSFLNRNGGRIYIGITDNKVVKGTKLTNSQMQDLQEDIQRLLSCFDPDVSISEYLKIMFIPILPGPNQAPIPGLYVVKIIVKQGDPTILYSNSKESLQCYMRTEGQSRFLSAKETRELLIDRFINPPQKIPESEFEDPEPETFETFTTIEYAKEYSKPYLMEDFKSNNEREIKHKQASPKNKATENSKEKQRNKHKEKVKTQEQVYKPIQQAFSPAYSQTSQSDYQDQLRENNVKRKAKKTTKKQKEFSPVNSQKQDKTQGQYFSSLANIANRIQVGGKSAINIFEIFVEGLPNWTEDEFINFKDSLGFSSLFSYRMFKNDTARCNGKAFLNFTDENEALQFISSFNGSSLYGKVLKVKLKDSQNQQTKNNQ